MSDNKINNRKTLIEKLQNLRTSDNEAIVKTAGLALAALDMNKNAVSLNGLIGNKLNNFDLDTGANPLSYNQLNEATKEWLGSGLIGPGLLNNNRSKGNADTNLLNQIAITISSCVEGKLSEDICKDHFNTFNNLSETVRNQKVNLKLVLSTLKSLGFKIYNEDNVLQAGTQNQRTVQSVDEWIKDNKDSLPKNLNKSLEALLDTFVLTANAYASNWDSEQPVPVKISDKHNKTSTKESNELIVLGVNTQMDGLTNFQKYYAGLLPVKAQKLGLSSLSGGAGLSSYNPKDKTGRYLSYVDEEVDSNKNFVTADVLENLFKQFRSQLDNKNITINSRELNETEKKIKELKEEELHLINLTAVIEKYLALVKYFDVDEIKPSGNIDKMTEEIMKLLEQHKDKLQNVEKNRKGLGNILLVMGQSIDTHVI